MLKREEFKILGVPMVAHCPDNCLGFDRNALRHLLRRLEGAVATAPLVVNTVVYCSDYMGPHETMAKDVICPDNLELKPLFDATEYEFIEQQLVAGCIAHVCWKWFGRRQTAILRSVSGAGQIAFEWMVFTGVTQEELEC